MKHTPLYPAHLDLGAKMVEFGGWEMPMQYSTILEEHHAVRARAGVFDVSHMGDLLIKGEGAEESLRELLTNDIKDLAIGKGLYAHVLDPEGRIIDDTITFRLSRHEFLMIPNAVHSQQMYDYIRGRVWGVSVMDVSEQLACIALQGPKAQEILQRMTDRDLTAIKRLRGELVAILVDGKVEKGAEGFLPDLLGPVPPKDRAVWCYATRSGYTGEDGFEILMESGAAGAVWNSLLKVGKDAGLVPCGLGSRDLLRLEMGYLLSGTDFDGTQTPLQTGPEWVVKWDHQFIGRDALEEQRERGGYRKLVGLELRGRGIPRHGYTIMSTGQEVGVVTSGTLSPSLNKGIALAYADFDLADEGHELTVRIRDAEVPAVIVHPPFLRKVGR
jgi:aminomethyltransferase